MILHALLIIYITLLTKEEMKRAAGVCVLALAVILLSGRAYAKDMAGRFGIGANWFYYLPSEDDFEGKTLDNEGTPAAFNIGAFYCLPQVTDRCSQCGVKAGFGVYLPRYYP
jgi:hypothetical protein